MSTCLTASEIISKDASEVLIIGFDFVDELDTDESIASATHSVSPSGLTIDSETYGTTQSQLTVSGGILHGEYVVRVVVTTNRNQTLVCEGLLVVCSE